MRWIALFLLLVLPSTVGAATGDILFQCNFEGAGTPAQVWEGCGGAADYGPWGLSTASILSGAGPDSSKAISFAYQSGNYYSSGQAYDPINTAPLGKNEVTVFYWERFSIPITSASGRWNSKGSRILSASDTGQNYIGGLNIRTGDAQIMLSNTGSNTHPYTFIAGTTVDRIYGPFDPTWDSADYCTPISGNTYACNLYTKFRTSNPPNGSTNWYSVRYHVKQPSTVGGTNGQVTLWINDVLVSTLTDVHGPESPNLPSTTVGAVRFYPDDSSWDGAPLPDYLHQYDNIVIYEGYVPPGDATCSDGIQNQNEIGIDCGGVCAACSIQSPIISKSTSSGRFSFR